MPVVLFKKSRGESHLFGVEKRSSVEGGTVQFKFKDQAHYERFTQRVHQKIYPLLSSAPFKQMALAAFGKDAVTKFRGNDRVNLTKAQFEKLRDPAFVAAAVKKAQKNSGFPKEWKPEQYGNIVSRAATFMVGAKDTRGVTAFDLFDINTRSTSATPKKDGRVHSVDVENFVIDTSLFGGNF